MLLAVGPLRLMRVRPDQVSVWSARTRM